jgi:thiamine-monophosphate kinase
MLREAFGAPPPPALGIGDDAAVLHDPRALVATVDAAVEGVHFRRDLLSLEDIAARACEAAMSDVAAMGGDLDGPGCGLLLAWAFPPSLDDDALRALARGARRAADRAGTRVVGGNLTRAAELSLTTTVLGRCAGAPLRRDGARPGDVVALSGPAGLAGIGLRALLTADASPAMAPAVERWRRPTARLAHAREIAGRATACVDLSDGLAQDAGHLAAASGVALHLDGDALLAMLPDALRGEAWSMLTGGGEDYELLATGPRSAFTERWRVIGVVCEGRGVFATRDGVEAPLRAAGWDHFSLT